MATQHPAVSQTRSFSTIFLIEMWERFGYYGMQALIVYYMVQRLGFADERANLVWSAAAALIYVAPAIGGWVGDRVLGTRRTMLLGAMVLGIGYALMAVPTESTWALFGALGVIVVGNGLFKPNAGNLVRKIYEGDDSRIDSAFTIYYMAVNIGSTISMLLTPWIKDYVNLHYGNNLGWHVAFGACCVGLGLGLVNYYFMRKAMSRIGSEPDDRPLNIAHLLGVLAVGALCVVGSAIVLQYETVALVFVYTAAIVLLGIFMYLITHSMKVERAGLIAALVLVVQTIFFFVFYQQMSTSLALFALRNVEWSQTLFGMHLFTWSPAQYQALNPIWIMLLSPILAWLYTRAGRDGKDLSIASKFALGFAMVATGFFIYGSAGHFAVDGKTSSWVMICGYAFSSLGELLVSGLGLAMIARYVPSRMGGFMMGAYYVASGVSQYLGGVVANFASIPNKLADLSAAVHINGIEQVATLFPQALQMQIEDFRQWIGVLPTQDATQLQGVLAAVNAPTYASLPAASQQMLTTFSDSARMATMQIYTNLFFWLGVAGVACTVIAIAVLPLMRKLTAQHANGHEPTALEGSTP